MGVYVGGGGGGVNSISNIKLTLMFKQVMKYRENVCWVITLETWKTPKPIHL